MSISGIISNVFEDFAQNQSKSVDINFTNYITNVSEWLEEKLSLLSLTESLDEELFSIEGIIGPKKIVFDCENLITVKPSKDLLTIVSQSAFSTVKANCCVYSGKWMYEVQLKSKGIMQIGWCSNTCQFTQDTGVGDTKYSYGLDGSKQRIWHVHTKKYGPYWRSGDIFGICIDMDVGRIEYYRNGVSLGEAFKGIERGPGLALYPAVSLGLTDSLTANFGGSPMKYPLEGYNTLQRKPTLILQQADCLLQYLINLTRLVAKKNTKKHEIKVGNDVKVTHESIYMVVASIIIEQLAPLIVNPYVVEDRVFNYIKSMCVLKSNSNWSAPIQPGSSDSTLGVFLTILWTYMEEAEMKLFLKTLIKFLINTYRETPVDLEYEKQRMIIVILSCLCNHVETRKYYLEYKLFRKNCLPLLVYTKPPDEKTLEEIIPDDCIWTEGLGGSKTAYLAACDKLKSHTVTLYNLKKHLITVLLTRDDGTEISPSSRKIFIEKFRKFVMDISDLKDNALFQMLEMQGTNASPTQPAIALSFLCIVIEIAKIMWETEISEKHVYIDPINFYDNTFKYLNIDRIGGVLSFLRRNLRNDLIASLGPDHPSITQPDIPEPQQQSEFSDIYSAMILITRNTNQQFAIPRFNLTASMRATEAKYIPVKPGELDQRKSICQLLDCSVLFYYAVAHKYIVMIADLRDNIAHLSNILIETKSNCEEIERNIKDLKQADPNVLTTHNPVLSELNERFTQRNDIFKKRSIELARKQAWYRSVALSPERRNLLCWLLTTIFETLQRFTLEERLFAFLPETYITILPILLDTILDFSFHDTGIQHDLQENSRLLILAADFLSEHLGDSRVILASCKDALIQALGSLTCHSIGVESLEKSSPECQLALVRALLRPYENRAWGQSNWLLLRFWMGDGFAFRESRPPSIWQGGSHNSSLGLYRSRTKNGSHTGLLHLIAPAYPSRYYQDLISQILNNDEKFCTNFVNSLLSQLNWAFSEFIQLLQDIQNHSHRPDTTNFDPKQLKICGMCFDLTISLMRAVEMLISILPAIVDDKERSNSDIMMGRISQLVIQVLSRVTIPPGCFQYVVDLCLPDLSNVTHFAIITAAIAILLALTKDEIGSDISITKIPRVTRLFLTDASFKIANIEFALGDIKTLYNIHHLPIQTPMGNFDPTALATYSEEDDEDLNTDVTPKVDKTIIPHFPIIRFKLSDYPDHISEHEIRKVHNLIDTMLLRQSYLSDITVLSEDSICTICCAKQNSVFFEPCAHQSCQNCIVQHLMNNKLCFYCKGLIRAVKKADGTVIYEALRSNNETSSDSMIGPDIL